MPKKKGNPNWGKPGLQYLRPEAPTLFEEVTAGIPEMCWHEHPQVWRWVKQNYRSRYVPETLLRAMGIDPNRMEVDLVSIY